MPSLSQPCPLLDAELSQECPHRTRPPKATVASYGHVIGSGEKVQSELGSYERITADPSVPLHTNGESPALMTEAGENVFGASGNVNVYVEKDAQGVWKVNGLEVGVDFDTSDFVQK